MEDPMVVLAHVLADTLARHEASDQPSLVRAEDGKEPGGWVGAFLDFERAGTVAATALESHRITEDGVFLFSLRLPPARGDATAGGSATPAVAASDDDWQALAARVRSDAPPSTDEPVGVLVARVISVSRRVFPNPAGRHNSLRSMMHEFGVTDPELSDLHKLDPAQLLKILDRLEYFGRTTGRTPETAT